MTFEEFIASTGGDAPPGGISDLLRALWFAEAGDWHASHEVAQDIHSADGSWIHAHLHREEGDLGNAGYWYNRAGKPVAGGTIEEERHALIRCFLG